MASLRTIKLFANLNEQELERVLQVSERHRLVPKTQIALDVAFPQRVLFVLRALAGCLRFLPAA